jgi:hypothetical protein
MQSEIQPVPGIRFELMTSDDFAECAHLVNFCFGHDEPFGDALFAKETTKSETSQGDVAKVYRPRNNNINNNDNDNNDDDAASPSPEGLELWLLPMQAELLALACSYKAVEDASGRIVGAFFVCRGHVPEMAHIAAVNADMGELYRELYRQWQPRPETTLQYLFSGVLPQFRRLGILSAARRHIIARGKEKGFRSVYSETSSYGSRRSLEALGAKQRAFISYSEWRNSKGEQPFAKYLAGATEEKPIPHTGFAVMEVEID